VSKETGRDELFSRKMRSAQKQCGKDQNSILDKTHIPRPEIKPESYTNLKIQLNTSKSYSTTPRNIILGKNKKSP